MTDKSYTIKSESFLFNEADPEGSPPRAEMRLIYRGLDERQVLEVEKCLCVDPVRCLNDMGKAAFGSSR